MNPLVHPHVTCKVPERFTQNASPLTVAITLQAVRAEFQTSIIITIITSRLGECASSSVRQNQSKSSTKSAHLAGRYYMQICGNSRPVSSTPTRTFARPKFRSCRGRHVSKKRSKPKRFCCLRRSRSHGKLRIIFWSDCDGRSSDLVTV